MSKTLGIYVSSDRHIDKLLRICRAAKAKGIEVKIFLTHIGTRLSVDPRFIELEQSAEIALCRVGFEANHLDRSKAPIAEKAYTTQSWHAEMIYDCDRYLSF